MLAKREAVEQDKKSKVRYFRISIVIFLNEI